MMAAKQGDSAEENYKNALTKVRQWCSSEEHCQWDVERKLMRFGCPASDIKNILHLLAAEDFINENRYALTYARSKFTIFKWGKNKIASGMRSKRIPESAIHQALENMDTEAYRESLLQLLNKKKREFGSETLPEKNRKLVRFALQKGYEAELIYELLRIPNE